MAKTSTKTSTTTANVTPAETTAPVAAKAPKTPKAPKAAVAAVEPVVSTPAAAAAATATPAEPAAKKVRAPKTPKAEVVVATPVVADAALETTAPTTDAPVPSSDFTSFSAKLQQVSALLSALKVEFRTLERKASRELKTATKAGAKRKRKTGNRSPSGFVKPTLISAELATFLGKTQGTEMARTEVTREINAYIRANSLQDKTNGRKINADQKLSSLLKLKAEEELTYFNLQRYMSPHFQKTVAAAPVVA